MQQHKLAMIGFDNSFYALPFADCCKPGSRMELVGVSDPSADKLAEYAKTHDIPMMDTDWRQLLDRCDCDVAVVYNITAHHEEVVVEAARRGKHIICIKPLATTLESALNMQKAVDESGVHFLMMHNYRFTPALQKVKEIIDSGEIGKAVSLSMNSRAVLPQDWPGSGNPGWYAEPALSGGGGFIDHASHTIDYAMWLFGDEMPKSVSGTAGNFMFRDLAGDDGGVAILEFENGAATLESTWYAPKNVGSVELLQVLCENGEIISHRVNKPVVELRAAGSEDVQRFEFEPPVWVDMLKDVAESFMDVIDGGKPNRAPISQGVAVNRVLDAFRESVKSGGKVKL